jgi:hypothetical protein
MFPSLALHRHIFNGPILRNEIAYLRSHTHNRNPWLRRAGYTLIAFATIMASLPLWIYITDDFPTYLLLPPMVVAIYGVQLMVSARTLILAAHIASRERQTGTWDSLVLTGIDARQILLSKWWAVMLHVWPGHVLAALLRGGLAYGLTQFFDAVNLQGCSIHFGNTLCYYSYPYYQGRLYPGYPSAKLLVIGIVILIGFALIEAGFLVVLGLFNSVMAGQHRNAALSLATGFRITLILIAVASWQAIRDHGSQLSYNFIAPITGSFAWDNRFSTSAWSGTLEVIHTVQLAIFTLADNATVLITDLMRPYAPSIHILRRLTAATCGIGLYAALILLILRLAQHIMIRRGALPPPAS